MSTSHACCNRRARRGKVPAAAVFVAAAIALCPPPGAAEATFGGDVTAATDYVTRGVSQTLSQAALQGSVYFAHDSGLSGYAWGSNVDFVAGGDPDDGARVEFDIALQYELALTERLAASLRRVHYLYPNTNPGFDYDYGEWLGDITLDGRHRLTLAYTGDIFAAGVAGWYVAASTRLDLPAGLALELQAGHVDLQRLFGESYVHASVAVSGGAGAFTWQVACHTADASARNAFYPSVVEPRAVLGVTYAVW